MPTTKHKSKKVSLSQAKKVIEQLSLKDQAKLRNTFLQDQKDIRIALERLAKAKNGKQWSLEELEQELGLAS